MPVERDAASPLAGPEFSRAISLSRIKSSPVTHQISASDEERKALASRFKLVALDRLDAKVTLSRQNGDIRLEADLEADLVQSCIVSLEPIPESVEDRFVLLYRAGIDEAEADRLTIEDYGDEVVGPLVGDEIDIGEAVAQQLSLAMEPFPSLEASLEVQQFDGGGETADFDEIDSRFDVLRSLKKT